MRQLNSSTFGLPGRIDHDASVQEARVADAVGGHAVHGRNDHLAHDARVHFRRDHRRRRIGAHAAGVGALIAVAQALVILRRGKGKHIPAVDHRDEARFLARKKVLDDDARTRVAHRVFDQHRVDGRIGFGARLRDDHALARGETIGLDDDGCAALGHIVVSRARVGESAIAGGRQPVARHERLGEILGALEPRCRARRAENRESRGTKGVDDAGRERRLRSDDRERDLPALREIDKLGNLGQRDIGKRRFARRAAVARRDEHARDARALRNLPRERVLPAAAADHEDVHECFIRIAELEPDSKTSRAGPSASVAK